MANGEGRMSNKELMLDIQEKRPLPPEIPDEWNFEEANKEFDELIYSWRRLTIDVLERLYIFYIKLAQPGIRTDLSSNDDRLPTWKEWLELKGIGLSTPTRHFKKMGWPIIIEKQSPWQPDKVPEGMFSVIYADPPWKYDFAPTEKTSIESHYETLTVEQIINYQDKQGNYLINRFFDNCVLFLWATAPKLREALDVMRGWGFEYKTHAIWDKERTGMGFWFLGQHELLLIGVKGKYPPPPTSLRCSSIYREQKTIHSKKPEYFYDHIETTCPTNRYLEIFGRKKHNEKWEVIGNEYSST